jgi:hypothetical protein
MEKIFLDNVNLQLLRNMDWKSVDGTNKIFEIKSFDFQHIKSITDFEEELRIIKEEFQTPYHNGKWQVTAIVTIGLPNTGATTPLTYFKEIISKTIPRERYFYEEIKYKIPDTKKIILNFQDIFLDNLILNDENIDLSESFAKFIVNATNKPLPNHLYNSEHINSIINKLLMLDKEVDISSRDSNFFVENIHFKTYKSGLQENPKTRARVVLNLLKIMAIFEEMSNIDRRESCIYYLNFIILKITSPKNIVLTYVRDGLDIPDFDMTIILPHVNFNNYIKINDKLLIPSKDMGSNSNKFKVLLTLPDLNIQILNEILLKLEKISKFIIVNRKVNINDLLSNFSEGSIIQKNNILYLITILKFKDSEENQIEIIADTSRLGSDKISNILRVYLNPTLIKFDISNFSSDSCTLILPDDDEFYKKAFKMSQFKEIYYKLVNDFIFSANTTDNSYFSTEMVDYKSLFGETSTSRKKFLELLGLYLDDQEITKDLQRDYRKNKKKIDKLIKNTLKINYFKLEPSVDPIDIFTTSFHAIGKYKKFLKDNQKNSFYLPNLADIEKEIITNYLNIFRTKYQFLFKISINENASALYTVKTKERIESYRKLQLEKNGQKKSQIDEELKDLKIIINFEKNNFTKFDNFRDYMELINNICNLKDQYYDIPPIINLQTDEAINMISILPRIGNFNKNPILLEQIKDRINFLFERIDSIADVNDDNLIELFKTYANTYNLYFPEAKYISHDFINRSSDYFKPKVGKAGIEFDKILKYVYKKYQGFKQDNKKERIEMFDRLVYYCIYIFYYDRKIVYNINLPRDNKKQFLNNLQDRLIIEINKNGIPTTSVEEHMPIIILKFDELNNFYPLQKIIKKYDIDNRYQNLEFIVNKGKDVMNKKKFDDVKDDFLRICNKLNKKNKNVLDFQSFNKTIINSIDREFPVNLPSVKKSILEQIFYNINNAKIIDISSDEFYKDLWYMNKPDNTNILIEYMDQSREMLTITSEGKFYPKDGFIHNRFFIGDNFLNLKQLDKLVNEKNYKNKVYTFSKSGISDVHILRFKILNIFDGGDDIEIKIGIRKLLNLNNILSTYTNLVKLNHLKWSYVDSIGIDAGGPLRLSLLKISEEIGINIMEPIKYKNNECLFYNFKKKKDQINDIYKDGDDTSNFDVFLGKLFSKCLIFNYVMSINLDPLIYYIIIKSFNFINSNDLHNNLDGSFFNRIDESKMIISSYIKDNLLATFSNLKEFLDIELEIYDENLLGSECRHYDYLINLAKMSKQDWGDFDEDDNENLLVARESNGEIKKIYPYPFDDSIMQTPLTLKSEKNCFVESKEDDTKIKEPSLCNEKKFITFNKLVDDDKEESKFKSVKIPAIIKLNFCNSKGKCQEHPAKPDRVKLKQSNFKLYNKLKKKAREPYIKKYNWDDNGKEEKIKDYFKYMLEGNRLNSISNFTWGFLYNIYNISDRIGRTSQYQQRFINNFEKLTVRDLDTLITGIREIQIDDFIKNMIARKRDSGIDIDSEYTLTIFEIIKNQIRKESQRDKHYLNLLHKVFLDSWNVPIGGFVSNLKLRFYPSNYKNRQIMEITNKDDANKITITDIENTIDGITDIHSCFGQGDVYTNDKYETLFNDKLIDPTFNNMTEKIKFVEKEGLVKDILKFFTLESMKKQTESLADNPYNIG